MRLRSSETENCVLYVKTGGEDTKPFIIVTLRSSELTMTYDIEVPTDVAASHLSAHIAETINAYLSKEQPLKGEKYSLKCVRMGRTLNGGETLGDVGVWNGDILSLEKC